MSTASPPEDNIFQGVWNNELKGGGIFGTTLTVNAHVASILSPALALIISIAGSQLWRLFQFGLHQSRATQGEKNFLFHQQQVTLRNTATDLNTLWRLLRLAFAWRRHSDIRVFWESFPLLLWTSLHLTLIILIGLFSSWLLEAPDYVLSRSQWCGQYDQNFINQVYYGPYTDDVLAETFAYSNYKNSRFAVAQQYLDVCSTSFEGCDVLITNDLPYNRTVTSGACPFADSICHPNADTITFDTGYLSSASKLGLNAPAHDRVSFRMQAKCAPLDDAAHVTGWQLINATSNLPAHQVSDALYGLAAGMSRNATFSYSKPVMECSQESILLPYELYPVYCPANGSMAKKDATFDPIAQLRSTTADTSLIMLMTNSRYKSPVLDPWFTAQLAINDTDYYCRGGNSTVYARQTPLTTIGCTQQWQICNTDSPTTTNDDHCTSLQGIYQLQDAFSTSSELQATYNARQLATVDWITNVAQTASFYYLIQALAQTTGPPIKARSLITGTLGMSVPDGQWQVEVEYWMQGLLAYIQQSSIDSSTGQFAYDTRFINRTTPQSDATGAAYRLCQNQIIRSSSYRNFNFFAMVLCIVLCVIITILGLTIEDIIGFVRQQRFDYIEYHGKKDMWFINSDLEMLRTITELKNKLLWSRSSFGIPFAPVGTKAVIDDLRSDKPDVDDMSTYTRSSRRNTALTTASLAEKRKARSYGVHQHSKSCVTCESFEMVPTGTPSSTSKHLPDNREEGIHAANAVSSQVTYTEGSSPQSVGVDRTTSGPDVRAARQAGHSEVVGKPSYLQWANTIPSSTDLSINPINKPPEHGIPMLLSDDSSDKMSRNRLTFGLGRKNVIADTPEDSDSEDVRRDRSWFWPRQKQQSGPIC